MEYEVTLDFGDNALHAPKICHNLTELGLYLERIPSMIAFELHGKVTVKIERNSTRRTPLPTFEREALTT